MQTRRKTMIVTGAAEGIGAGVTNAFIERDAAQDFQKLPGTNCGATSISRSSPSSAC
jgi:hypothetical protein